MTKHQKMMLTAIIIILKIIRHYFRIMILMIIKLFMGQKQVHSQGKFIHRISIMKLKMTKLNTKQINHL